MDKRYQVFVSSTYADLREERQRVIQALMEMDCIPSGMELFPAADEEQWSFIKRVIDDCDYYLLIIGGRYGSTTPDGISYTEKEYDYAIEKGLKVIALLHASPEEITLGKSEVDPVLRERLKVFREKVAKNRLVRFWRKADELPGLVALSLAKTIKTYPATGWVRANQISNNQLLTEINELRKVKDELEQKIVRLKETQAVEIPDLATFEDTIRVFGTTGYTVSYDPTWSLTLTWRDLFRIIAPHLSLTPGDEYLRSKLAVIFCRKLKKEYLTPDFDEEVYQTIKIQFQMLGLTKVEPSLSTSGQVVLFWSLTKQGQAAMMLVGAARTTPKDETP